MQCTDVIHRQPKLYCQIMGRETQRLGSNVLMLSIYDADVKKTHKKSMYRANPKGTESHQTFRGWVRFQNHRTRTEQINRVLRSIQTGRERRWSSSGVTERFTYWHLVLTKLVSTLSLACPLINKTEMQVQLLKVNVDSFVHVWGNKSVNYTSMDINVFFPLKQRHTDWYRKWICFPMNYASLLSYITIYTSMMFTSTLWRSCIVHCELAAPL